jgi:sigma-B regulation protein RsbU (phosphoserine phosphatase)
MMAETSVRPDSGQDRIARIVFSYAARIGREANADAMLRLNADMARELVGADRCSIWMVDEESDDLWTRVAHGVPEIRIPAGTGLVGAAVTANETIVVNDTSKDPRFAGRVDAGSGYVTKSVLVLPLAGSDGKVIGAIQALNKPEGFSDADVGLLGIAAGYSASALESLRLRAEAEASRLLRRELEIAQGVQQRLLPQSLPQVEGVEVAGFCRAASFVGGDYYDFIELPEGDLLLTLGDVAGKGVAASVLMASLQASLRTLFSTRPASLADAIGTFNKAVCRMSSTERYSTLTCFLCDAGARRLTYVNAGHVNPFLLRADGELQRLDAGGMPVGLLGFARYEQGEIEVAPGDLLVCVSDGISEAANPAGDLWDEPSLEAVIRSCRGLPAKETVERVVARADEFADGADQSDDMTVVAARFAGSGGSAG